MINPAETTSHLSSCLIHARIWLSAYSFSHSYKKFISQVKTTADKTLLMLKDTHTAAGRGWQPIPCFCEEIPALSATTSTLDLLYLQLGWGDSKTRLSILSSAKPQQTLQKQSATTSSSLETPYRDLLIFPFKLQLVCEQPARKKRKRGRKRSDSSLFCWHLFSPLR